MCQPPGAAAAAGYRAPLPLTRQQRGRLPAQQHSALSSSLHPLPPAPAAPFPPPEQDIVAPLLHVTELRRHGVTLHMLLDSERQPIPDVPAVYFVRPTEAAVRRIVADAGAGLYDSFHLNFSTQLPRPLLEALAGGAVAGGGAARVARVFDQHAQFVGLEGGVFSLGLPEAYLHLNDPAAQDTQIEVGGVGVCGGLCVFEGRRAVS